MAQLDGYTGILSFGRGRLSRMEPRLRSLLDSALAQESEPVRVAVLQHFVDDGIMQLTDAPFTIRVMLTNKHYSLTIPDDPYFNQLLLKLLDDVYAELGMADDSGGSTRGLGAAASAASAAAPAARAGTAACEAALAAAPVQRTSAGGGSSSSKEACPGTPPHKDSGGNMLGAEAIPGVAADLQAAICSERTTAAPARCVLRRRRHR